MLTSGLFTSATDEWATPQGLFNQLDETFHFEIDVCASAENAKCERYFTKEQDGLQQDWGGGCYLVQSAVWPRDWQVGREMCKANRSVSYAVAS